MKTILTILLTVALEHSRRAAAGATAGAGPMGPA